jgi:hypothetical protein
VTAKTFILIHGDTPASLNAGGVGSRRHWGVAHREKVRWQEIWNASLLANNVPKGMAHVYIDARLEFRDKRRRDAENYRPSLCKPLADVLVKGGWIPDDDGRYFELGRVRIVNGADIAEASFTTLFLEAEYV